jgi:hypothetical protein
MKLRSGLNLGRKERLNPAFQIRNEDKFSLKKKKNYEILCVKFSVELEASPGARISLVGL